MGDRDIKYKAAYIGRFPAFEEDADPLLGWALERSREHDSGIAVVAPTKNHFREMNILRKLPEVQ